MTQEDEIKAVAAKAVPNGQADSIFIEQGGTAFVHVLANGKRFTVFVNTKTKRVEGIQGEWEVAYAAQVAKALLADVPDDKDIVASVYLCGVHRAKEGQQYREAAGVVPDTGCIKYCALAPHDDVGAFGEDRIEMRRHYD